MPTQTGILATVCTALAGTMLAVAAVAAYAVPVLYTMTFDATSRR